MACAYPAAIANPPRTRAARLLAPALALALALAAGALSEAATTGAASSGAGPRLTGLRCVAGCAGIRAGGEGGRVSLAGHHLGHVDSVRFRGDPTGITVAPLRVKPRSLIAEIPAGAASGHPRVSIGGAKEDASPERLRVARAGEVPPPGRFKLEGTDVHPHTAFFDQRAPLKLSYRFESADRKGVRVELVRGHGRKVVRTWRHRGQLPYSEHSQTWNGLEKDGDVADDGTYRFRVGSFGDRDFAAGELKLHGYRFPVRGSHGYGGSGERFGAPRSGGRVHQGQDVFAACGTPLEAARGGEVQAKAYDPQLYGNYVVIDAAKTPTDHMYVHMASPARVGVGERVYTGERIGSVGRTGNARSEACQLHFEMWPGGWRHGSPVDPLPALKRWDGYS